MKKRVLFSLQWKILAIMVTVLLASFWLYSSIADNQLLVALDKQLHFRLDLVGQQAKLRLPINRLADYQNQDSQTGIYQKDLTAIQQFVIEQQLDRLVIVNSNQRIAIDSQGLLPGQVFGFGGTTSAHKNIMLFRTTNGIWQKAVVLQLNKGARLYIYAGRQMLDAIQQARSKRYWILSFSLLLAFVFSWLLVMLLTKRFARLMNAFQALQTGHRDVNVPSSGSDEITYLSKAFNQMASEIQLKADHIQNQHEQRLSDMKILSAGVAHEIRNPLSAVSGIVELLERDSSIVQSHDTKDLLKRVNHEIDRMNTIIIDMMAYAKQPALVPTLTNIPELLDSLNHSQITFTLKMTRPLPQLLLDPAGIRSVLRNLLINAHEAAGSNGPIVLGTRLYKKRLHIYVTNNGPGISQEAKSKLFMPFYSSKSRGSGLGLAIAKNIVQAHHGKLHFRSSQKGTFFTVALPIPGEV